ncbi:hypothetical protein QBC44DRAFT_156726 [Cladorrhinum sp. PSN332]|nr:hypothetical protein QBC44DRAFT_156726 [Cladorrhinum sp. PSN332]
MAATSNAQYQHFVPQFLLRNFSHPYKPDGYVGKKRKGSGKRKFEKGMFPGDPVVRHLDLTADPPAICEKPVKRILGLMNMYDDPGKPTKQQQEVEQLLSKLEGQASVIFRKITKAYENKDTGLCITRTELHIVRKFLFLLKYRGHRFYQRFSHGSPEEYNADDRELVREYMAKSGFTKPLEVWLQAIKAIINLTIDLESNWKRDLPNEMFTNDALWFTTEFENYYMAICTSADPHDEFILADNSYGVFEGRNTFVRDGKTGKVEGGAYTPLHMFAPISPKLIIVLRAVQLPNALEDTDDTVRQERGFQRSLILGPPSLTPDPEWGGSLLAGLPIEKARNNYTQVVNGRLEFIQSSQPWKPTETHRFQFTFFQIDTKHINIINGIFLDHLGHCTSVVFESMSAFRKTIEWVLTAPCDIAGKIMVGTEADVREAALKKIISVACGWGFQGEPVWKRVVEPLVHGFEAFRQMNLELNRELGALARGEKDGLDLFRVMFGHDEQQFSPDSELFQLYSSLGGTYGTFFKDFDQARRMWILRVKIDAWSSGKVAETIRQRNRELLLDAYLRLPPRRVWIYSSFQKFVILSRTLDLKPEATAQALVRGPERIIIRAQHILKPDKLSALIHRTGLNNTNQRRNPHIGIWEDFKSGKSGGESAGWLMKLIMEDESASIRHCGIPEIEEAFVRIESDLRESEDYYASLGLCPPWFLEIVTELMVRREIRTQFTRILGPGGKLEDPLLNELKTVLFDVAYPTPPDDFEWE